MNKNILFTIFFSIMSILLADPPDWEDCPGCFEFTATISGGIVLDEDGNQMGNEDDGDIFAAFDEDGNVRGVAIALFPPFGPNVGTCVYEMQMRSNAEGDLLSFKYYDASEDAILDISETYEFVINDILGNVTDAVYIILDQVEEVRMHPTGRIALGVMNLPQPFQAESCRMKASRWAMTVIYLQHLMLMEMFEG